MFTAVKMKKIIKSRISVKVTRVDYLCRNTIRITVSRSIHMLHYVAAVMYSLITGIGFMTIRTIRANAETQATQRSAA